LDTVVEEPEKVVGDDAFEGFAVGVAEADPEAVKFGSREEQFATRFEAAIEFADEIERANAFEGDLLVCAVGSQKVERINLTETGRVEVSLQGLAVHERDNDLLMG